VKRSLAMGANQPHGEMRLEQYEIGKFRPAAEQSDSRNEPCASPRTCTIAENDKVCNFDS
jgi:hypothetical protein